MDACIYPRSVVARARSRDGKHTWEVPLAPFLGCLGVLLDTVRRLGSAAPLPVVAPLGRGTYSRPAIYAVYTLSLLNGDAQYTLWNPGDIRAGHTDVHYLGLGAEWWFNSSYR